MADMVFLQGTYGSRVVFAGCPSCGRISRQTLTEGFSGQDKAVLSPLHRCPVCAAEYERFSTVGCQAGGGIPYIGNFQKDWLLAAELCTGG